MKICLLNVLHDALDKRMCHKVARSLVEAGHEVVSIAPRSPFLPDAPGQDGLSRDGVRFVFVPDAPTLVRRLRAVPRLIRLGRSERADLYLAPEPESWVAALLIKALSGGKVVFDMHEYVPGEFAKFFPPPLRRPVERVTVAFMRLFARGTDLILLTRESFEPLWRGLPAPRAVVINTNRLQPPCAAIPESVRQVFGGHPAVLHQGLFGDSRGSWQLLEAMKIAAGSLPELRCVLLGRYVYGDEAAYRRAVETAGLGHALLFAEEVPFDAVPAYIAAARVGLILFQPGPTNHTLAMPHKLFDYMREGRPVIAPDFAVEVARIVRGADCGLLVDVTSPAAIAEAILRMLRDPEEAERLGANGRRAVEETYNWQRDGERLLQAIAALE